MVSPVPRSELTLHLLLTLTYLVMGAIVKPTALLLDADFTERFRSDCGLIVQFGFGAVASGAFVHAAPDEFSHALLNQYLPLVPCAAKRRGASQKSEDGVGGPFRPVERQDDATEQEGCHRTANRTHEIQHRSILQSE